MVVGLLHGGDGHSLLQHGQNPLLDDTGEHSFVNQNGPVWFLAGTFGEGKCPKRKCAIPAGKAILFPVINFKAL